MLQVLDTDTEGPLNFFRPVSDSGLPLIVTAPGNCLAMIKNGDAVRTAARNGTNAYPSGSFDSLRSEHNKIAILPEQLSGIREAVGSMSNLRQLCQCTRCPGYLTVHSD